MLRVPKEELLTHSAAVPLKGASVQSINRLKLREGLSLKPMQVCFVRGLSSPRSHASYLAHIAPVSKGHSGPQESRRGPMKVSTDRNWNRANPGHAKHAGRACVMDPNCLITSRAALALQASQPLAKTWSCGTPTPVRDESHARIPARILLLGAPHLLFFPPQPTKMKEKSHLLLLQVCVR
jgi:hypothetical protein